jgi:predicted HTH transcriptional regulator
MIEPDDECLAPNKEKKPSFSVSIHNFAPLDSVKVEGISEKDMDILIYHISHDKYTSNKQIREWLEVDKDTAAKVIYALRKAGYIGDEYSNYMIPVNITTEVYFRLRSYNNSTK